MKGWSVVHTRPHQEARAEVNLKRQGFAPWLPVTKRSRRHARRIDTVSEPLFPGYIFVELDKEEQNWSPINGTYGVKYLITDGKEPKFLPEDFAESIRSLPGDEATYHDFQVRAGDQVKFVSGPFVDSIATVRGMLPNERVKLLLHVLGGSVTTTVSTKDVLPAP